MPQLLMEELILKILKKVLDPDLFLENRNNNKILHTCFLIFCYWVLSTTKSNLRRLLKVYMLGDLQSEGREYSKQSEDLCQWPRIPAALFCGCSIFNVVHCICFINHLIRLRNLLSQKFAIFSLRGRSIQNNLKICASGCVSQLRCFATVQYLTQYITPVSQNH